jgi:hypothetical protein
MNRLTRRAGATGALAAIVFFAAGAARADGTGTVEGRIRYLGARKPAPPATVPPAMQAACGKTRPLDTLVVGAEGGLANAVVSIARVPGAQRPPAGHATVDQKACLYAPHVQAVPAGSSLTILNSDPTLHNVHARRGALTLVNLAMPIQGQKSSAPPSVLAAPGAVGLRCDAGHAWMSAWIHVFDHPYYAVTDAAGAFRITGLPPGTYELHVEHETLGATTHSVTVAAGAPARADVDLQ